MTRLADFSPFTVKSLTEVLGIQEREMTWRETRGSLAAWDRERSDGAAVPATLGQAGTCLALSPLSTAGARAQDSLAARLADGKVLPS